MSVIRVRKDANYFAASNEPFNDKRLSWGARGLMGYLLSKPDGWEVRNSDLIKQGPAGEHKIRRMLAELRKFGYMNRIRLSLPDKTFDWVTEVYESPSQNPHPEKGIIKKEASGRFSTSGSSTSGKVPHIVTTDEINNEEEDAKNAFSLYEQEIGVITPKIADALADWEKLVPAKWIEDAISIAVKQNARNMAYIEGILKRWKAQGNQEDKKPVKSGNKYGKKQSTTPAPVVLPPDELEKLIKEAEIMFAEVK